MPAEGYSPLGPSSAAFFLLSAFRQPCKLFLQSWIAVKIRDDGHAERQSWKFLLAGSILPEAAGLAVVGASSNNSRTAINPLVVSVLAFLQVFVASGKAWSQAMAR